MCTYEFLKEVYENSTFAFEMHEVRVRNVVTCPSLAQLQTMSVRALEGILHHKINCIPASEFKITVLLTHVGSRQASKRWYLEFLSTIHARGYP